MTKSEQYAEIVAGVLTAIDCSNRGESHERLNTMMTRTAARNAAFYPPCPISVRPIERQPFIVDKSTDYYDFTTPVHGAGGAVRQG